MASAQPSRTCWIDTKTNIAAPLVPQATEADPRDSDHRTRVEMRGDDGAVYPAADFVRAPSGLWFDAVTGRSAEGVPEGSSFDPMNPDRRVVYGSAEGEEDVIKAEYRRAPCAEAVAKAADATAAAADLDLEILAEINAARTDPAGYAARLKGSNTPEVQEAIDFLKRQRPLPPLKPHVALLTAASRHAADQGRAGTRSHVGTDGSSVRDRVVAAGARPTEVGEEIAFDADSGMGVARQLIVDFGVPDRAHRTSLFNASLAYAGVACTPHTTYRLICVIDVSGPIGR
jgi:uncharacterized protein YkwD